MKIVIASGKGGTGKTFLSTNLFKTMENSGLDTVLVDCDAEVPNASIFVGGKAQESWGTHIFCPEIDAEKCIFCTTCQTYCTFHAITCVPAMHYIHLSADLCHGCEACTHACTSGAIKSGQKEIGRVTSYGTDGKASLFEARIHEGQRSGVPVIREAIQRAEDYGSEYLILDAPPGCSCPFVNTVHDADLVILITEPTPFGLNDLKQAIEVLRELKKACCVVINRSDLGNGQMEAFLKEEEIPILVKIPYSKDVARTYASGKLVVEEIPSMRNVFKQLMERIINYEDSNH